MMPPRRLAVLLVLLAAGASAAATSLRYADGRLTGRVEDVELADVLRDVARLADLELVGLEAAAGRVGAAFDDVPLAQALRRLLSGRSYLLAYEDGRPIRLTLLRQAEPARTDRRPPAAPPAAAPPAAATPPPRAALVPVSGRLARALGARRATFSDLMGAAMRSRDGRVRRKALRLAIHAIDRDPERHASVLRMLDGMDDARLAAWLRAVAGRDARRIVRRAARRARVDVLRARAAAVDRHLAGPAG